MGMCSSMAAAEDMPGPAQGAQDAFAQALNQVPADRQQSSAGAAQPTKRKAAENISPLPVLAQQSEAAKQMSPPRVFARPSDAVSGSTAHAHNADLKSERVFEADAYAFKEADAQLSQRHSDVPRISISLSAFLSVSSHVARQGSSHTHSPVTPAPRVGLSIDLNENISKVLQPTKMLHRYQYDSVPRIHLDLSALELA